MATVRGTAYEHACRHTLQHWLRMRVYRTGGANDCGMDLCGWWSPQALQPPPAPAHHDWMRVIVQCKALAKPAGPSIVRELEGTLVRALWDKFQPRDEMLDPESVTPPEAPLVGVLAALSGFSKQAILQARSSRIPMLLLHLTSPHDDFRDLHCAGFVWNEALANGALRGRLDVGWVEHAPRGRSAPTSRVVLYHDGVAVA
ncbi:hypothetical protein MOBT1_002869 [Malassezia obtusa]|uniref:Restriction endonuclease type IV Mrr domain-containing protein n=1 Tax=Malassezia obtusa TaxID=76774 RepID=A0AAF0E2F7_9BASI|nr:hypothetical protein MOBT1_002869 [Malassezia obtusa]